MIDAIHEEELQIIKASEDRLPLLRKKKKKYKLELNKDMEISKRLDLQDDLAAIKQEIVRIKNRRTTYHLDNDEQLFRYYENQPMPSKTINSFFNIVPEEVVKNENYLNHFTGKINIEYVNPMVCTCNGEYIEDEGVLICNKCHTQKRFIESSPKPNYGDLPNAIDPPVAYKRLNHFKEVLNQFQGKENIVIPKSSLDVIKLHIHKYKLEYISINETKDILKKYGLKECYEHPMYVRKILNYDDIPFYSNEEESKLYAMFNLILPLYSKYCPVNRKNLLNYHYLLYKMLEVIKETKFLYHISLFKERLKIAESDTIWKNICYELEWEYNPTI
jgi:hypothetical protein